MRAIDQKVDDIVQSLSPLDVEWMDDTAGKAIAKLAAIDIKSQYSRSDLIDLLSRNFDEGILCCRLFLALSKDTMESRLRDSLGDGGIGVKRFQSDQKAYLDALEGLGLLHDMASIINHKPVWSDILVERLRSGRGSAIQGQKRGRGLEDFSEQIVREVFGDIYEVRCTFVGSNGHSAKCDIAIPNRSEPRIIIESKAYNATGSKMTDIIGDLDGIIKAKRHDTALLFITDGMTWKARMSDLAKIVSRQNQGQITRIYTMQMREIFLADLRKLKDEYGL